MTTAPPPDPDLPEAVGTMRASRTDVVMTVVVFLVLAVVLVLARGVRSFELADELAPWVLLPALVIGVRTARLEVSVGPGWVSSREYVKRRWVRTDRLVRLKDSAGGLTDRNLDLVDADGRKASVSLRDLRQRPEMHRRFCTDVRRSIDAGAVATERVQLLLADGGATGPRRGRRGR